MAASFELGGVGEDKEQSGDKGVILDLWRKIGGKETCWWWWCVGNGREGKERVLVSGNGFGCFAVLMVFV